MTPRPVIRSLSIALAAGIAVAAAAWAVAQLRQPTRFAVGSVYFSGELQQVTREQLIAATASVARGNLFMLDLDAVKAQVEALPWVHRASVRRQWPPALLIEVTSQQIVASWGPGGWLNRHGEWVDLGDQAPRDAATLPQLTGPEGSLPQVWACYMQLSHQLKPAGLSVARLEFSARRTWRLQLDNKLVLLLGREPLAAKLDRFLKAWPAGLARYHKNIKQIDLRYPHGLAVAWSRPAEAPLALYDVRTASRGTHYAEEKR